MAFWKQPPPELSDVDYKNLATIELARDRVHKDPNTGLRDVYLEVNNPTVLERIVEVLTRNAIVDAEAEIPERGMAIWEITTALLGSVQLSHQGRAAFERLVAGKMKTGARSGGVQHQLGTDEDTSEYFLIRRDNVTHNGQNSTVFALSTSRELTSDRLILAASVPIMKAAISSAAQARVIAQRHPDQETRAYAGVIAQQNLTAVETQHIIRGQLMETYQDDEVMVDGAWAAIWGEIVDSEERILTATGGTRLPSLEAVATANPNPGRRPARGRTIR